MEQTPFERFDYLYDFEAIRDILFPVFGRVNEAQWNLFKDIIEWEEISGGEQLIKQGAPSDCVYFLVHGRLTAIFEDDTGSMIRLGDVEQGQSVGEIGFFTDIPRSAHVYANRDSVLLKLSGEIMQRTLEIFPGLTMQVMKTVMARASSQYSAKPKPALTKNILFLSKDEDKRASAFIEKFDILFRKQDDCLLIHPENMKDLLGLEASELRTADALSLLSFHKKLESYEKKYNYLILWAHEGDTDWVLKAIRHADVFYFLKSREASPVLSQAEELIFDPASYFKYKEKHLVVLHADGASLPQNTAQFFTNRSFDLHHHVRMDKEDDTLRIIRFIRSKSIGIAYSGGGARGTVYPGMYSAMRAKGLPIDFFSGTSVGAISAAFCAMDLDDDELHKRARSMADLAPTRRRNMSLIPLVSLMKGEDLDAYLSDFFENIQIEDLWINFSCLATNMTTRSIVEFNRGSLADAIRASISLPGIFPPAVKGNDLLVDGGVLENLPLSSLIKNKIAKKIIVTLHNQKTYELNYKKVPDSWEYLKNKIRGKKMSVPGITTMMMESMVIASYSKYPEAIAKADLHLHPPVEKIGLLEWNKFGQLYKIGKKYIEEHLTDQAIAELLA